MTTPEPDQAAAIRAAWAAATRRLPQPTSLGRSLRWRPTK